MPDSAAQSEETATFACIIRTPVRTVFEGAVTELRGETPAGAIEVLPLHEPLMTPLALGILRLYRPDGGGETSELLFALHGGFLHVDGENALVLADAAEQAEQIDIERAREALSRARDLLEGHRGEGGEVPVDEDRARKAMARALTRMRVRGATA